MNCVENIGEVNEEDIKEQVVDDEGDLDLDQPSSKSEHIQLINKVILNLQIINSFQLFFAILNSTFYSLIHQILPFQSKILDEVLVIRSK